MNLSIPYYQVEESVSEKEIGFVHGVFGPGE